jgi:hypothetical protein
MRNPAAFESDEAMQKYVQSGTARVVRGDATAPDDVRKAWEAAAKGPEREGEIDLVLLTIGRLFVYPTLSPSNNLMKQLYRCHVLYSWPPWRNHQSA